VTVEQLDYPIRKKARLTYRSSSMSERLHYDMQPVHRPSPAVVLPRCSSNKKHSPFS
jgi:hypothetical protein